MKNSATPKKKLNMLMIITAPAGLIRGLSRLLLHNPYCRCATLGKICKGSSVGNRKYLQVVIFLVKKCFIFFENIGLFTVKKHSVICFEKIKNQHLQAVIYHM